MQHGRLIWPTPDELNPERRRVYDKIVGGRRAAGPQLFQLTDDSARLHGPFNAMLVAPAVGKVVQEIGSAIRYRTSLADRPREIAILIVAVERRSNFEWYAHEAVGRYVGLTADELTALLEDQDAASFDEVELTVTATCRALLRRRALSESEFVRAQSALSDVSLAELITLVGYYDLLSLSLSAWCTPLPDGVVGPFEL